MSQEARILVVDDDEQGRQLLARALQGLGRVRVASDGMDALEEIKREAPDLILSDVLMPRLNGIELCQRLKRDPLTRLIPVVILTSLDQMPDKIQALEVGADDYLIKPYHLNELVARSRALLRLKRYTDELESASTVLHAVAEIVEKRDHYTSKHCEDVARLCAAVAGAMSLDPDAVALLRLGARFHDIGKVGVPDAILHKRGPLDAGEIVLMQSHAALGAELLAPMRSMQPVVTLVRHHHERLDGSGYPDGLRGEQISPVLRILSVVDIFTALASARPYKAAFAPDRCIAILREEAALGWWDGAIVEELARLVLPRIRGPVH